MNYIDQLITEHQEITTQVSETRKLLPLIHQTYGQKLLLKQISTLTDCLISHLIDEENIIYPEFLKSCDIRIRAKADVFITELNDLKEIFGKFKDQFKTLEQITNNLDHTKETTQNILFAIERRVYKEENDLFIAAKKMLK